MGLEDFAGGPVPTARHALYQLDVVAIGVLCTTVDERCARLSADGEVTLDVLT
jgi:hypothetical protein